MTIGESLSHNDLESANTNSIKQSMLGEMTRSKDYRHSFVEESIRSRLAAQIAALRDDKGWDYKTFANELNKKVGWAYRLEDPNDSIPTIPSLLQVALTFDVGLDVRFLPFSDLLDDVLALRPGSFSVPSFGDELKAGSFSSVRLKRKIRCSHTGPKRSRKLAHDAEVVSKYIGAGSMPVAKAA
ncbi:MAG: hypothetical protein ACLP59_21360 [Bryobacteraceae bacterium]